MKRVVLNILSLLLCSAMLVAQNSSGGYDVALSVDGAEGVLYETLTDAMTAANNIKDKTLRLTVLRNIDFNGAVPQQKITKSMTLDLNGYIIGTDKDTLIDNNMFYVNTAGVVLQVISSRDSGKIQCKKCVNGRVALLNLNKGDLVVDNIELEVTNTMPYDSLNAKGEAECIYLGQLANAKITNTRLVSHADRYAIAVFGNAKGANYSDIKIYDTKIQCNGLLNAYGMSVPTTIDIHNVDIDVTTTLRNAYGISLKNYVSEEDSMPVVATMRGLNISVSSRQGAYGINAVGAFDLKGYTAQIHADSIAAYGIYLTNKMRVDSAVIFSETDYRQAYGIYANKDSIEVCLSHCDIQTNARSKQTTGVYMNKGFLTATDCTIKVVSDLSRDTATTTTSILGINTTAKAALTLRRCSVDVALKNADIARGAVGVYSACKTDIEDCYIRSESWRNYAYGLQLVGTSKVKADNVTIDVDCYGNYGYGISAPVTAELDLNRFDIQMNGGSYIYGVYGYNKLSLTNSKIAVKGLGSSPYGISINKNANADERQAMIKNCRVEVNGNSNVNGIVPQLPTALLRDTFVCHADSNGCYPMVANSLVRADSCYFNGKTERRIVEAVALNNDTAELVMTHCRGIADARYNNAAGVSVRKGTLIATDCYFEATTHQDTASMVSECFCYGARIAANSKASLIHSTIQAAAKKKNIAQYVYGLYNEGHCSVDSCTLTATSDFEHAYSVYSQKKATQTNIRDSYLMAKAEQNAASVRHIKQAVGVLVLHGGYYSDKESIRCYVENDEIAVYSLRDGMEYEAGYRYALRSKRNPGVPVFALYDSRYIKQGEYLSLNEAIEAAKASADTALSIILLEEYMLSKGAYTIPRNTTLVVPMSAEQNAAIGEAAQHQFTSERASEYLCLSFDSVRMVVYGGVEVSAMQRTASSRSGFVAGQYGRLHLRKGSELVLTDNAHLQAWGYVTGEGEVKALKGSRVHELFQTGDWKGARAVADILSKGERIFPLTQYFYQNIEAPIVYYAGSQALASISETISDFLLKGDDICLVGDSALFEIDDDALSYIRREYSAKTDRITWQMNGNVRLSELNVTIGSNGLGYYSIKSRDFVLPISGNMDIVCQGGQFSMDHDIMLTPGARLTIADNAKFMIPDSVSLYLFDADEWGSFNGSLFEVPRYSPSWDKSPRDTTRHDAELIVNGEIYIYGQLLATKGGAALRSSIADNSSAIPTVIYYHSPAADKGTSRVLSQITGSASNFSYADNPVCSAPLMNADSSFTRTDEALEREFYVYYKGEWVGRHIENCIRYITDKEGRHLYTLYDTILLSPSLTYENVYMAVVEDKPTYMVWDSICYWHQVNRTEDGRYLQALTDSTSKYFYYLDSLGYWGSKVMNDYYRVNFVNDDGTLLESSLMPIGTMPFASVVPTKDSTVAEYYEFAGWLPELHLVDDTITYTAQWTTIPRYYEVTFLNFDSTLLQLSEFSYGEVPIYEGPTPIRQTDTIAIANGKNAIVEHMFAGFEPEIIAVVGEATYIATYTADTTEIRNFDDAVETIDYRERIFVSSGTLRVQGLRRGTKVYVYALTGQLYMTKISNDHEVTIELPTGEWIVTMNNGQ